MIFYKIIQPVIVINKSFNYGETCCAAIMYQFSVPMLYKNIIPTFAALSRQVRFNSNSLPLLESEPTSAPSKIIMQLAKEIIGTLVTHPEGKNL